MLRHSRVVGEGARSARLGRRARGLALGTQECEWRVKYPEEARARESARAPVRPVPKSALSPSRELGFACPAMKLGPLFNEGLQEWCDPQLTVHELRCDFLRRFP